MNKKYLIASVYWYLNVVLFLLFIILSSINYYITSLLIIILLYLSLVCCCAYIEIILLKNKKSWWIEMIYILMMRIPFVIEVMIIYFRSKKINIKTRKLLNILSDEELPIFMYFGTFLNYFKFKKFKNKVIELAIWETDIHNGLLKRLEFLDIKIKNSYIYKDKIYYYKMSWNHVTCYLYLINKKENNFASFYFDSKKIAIFPLYKLELRKYKISDFYLNGPVTPTKFLNHYYGKDWRFVYPNSSVMHGPNINQSSKLIITNKIKK